jgi:hypothetical protein
VVAGRAFAFADPEIITLAKAAFVPVCADDWYQRRRKDAEGEFFRKVADQGPRKGEGGSTRQGIYCLTADGELLAYKNAGQLVKDTRDQLKYALRKWAALPAGRRDPGAVTVPPHGPLDPAYARTVPAGGLVVRVHARILDRQGDDLVRGSCEFTGGEKAARDFLWVTAGEVKQLAPATATVGTRYPVPVRVAERILRFHLLDNTRGEPSAWDKDDIRAHELMLTVTAATADAVDLRLDGSAVLATAADPDRADRGYEVRLLGMLRYRPGKGTFDRFDVAALGEHWGVGTHTRRGVRPGRGLLGIAFGLADPAVPANRVPPQGARDKFAYFGTDK